MKMIYQEIIDGKKCELDNEGNFFLEGKKEDWFKSERGKNWIPRKRKSFVSLCKQIIRE